LSRPFLYVAVPATGGAVRVAEPSAVVEARVREIRNQVLIATSLAFLPAALLAAFFARSVSSKLAAIIDYARQLAEGNFGARRTNAGRGVLGLLAAKLNETGEKLVSITNRVEAEHRELEKLERVRKDFVINVSHELRTPLASIQGYTETLLDGAVHDPANNVKFLHIIRQNAERLARLTADLLVLSRVELGQQKFNFASYRVNQLLTDNADAMRPLASPRRVDLILEPAPPDAEVFCDAEAVHQILSNLLDNAIKFTPEGGAITIGAKPLSDTQVEFFVRDTGMGIPAEDLARLFERFYRVDKARSRALGGTGLGLAIVKHLARAMGGDVRVESKSDQGSVFFFTVPARDLGLAETGAAHTELTVS
jgi:two-component system phosphate regulon sensor histidine kinase PhoR